MFRLKAGEYVDFKSSISWVLWVSLSIDWRDNLAVETFVKVVRGWQATFETLAAEREGLAAISRRDRGAKRGLVYEKIQAQMNQRVYSTLSGRGVCLPKDMGDLRRVARVV